jgi:hypothetical protein
MHHEVVRESKGCLVWHPVGVRNSSHLNRWSSLRSDHPLLSANPPGFKLVG